MKTGTYKVSIIVPVYNVEKYIERCARSIFEQTYKNLEIIFVDDHTPDKSINILKQIIKEYPARKEQVTILQHQKNQGLATARNTGLKAVTGEYILHCDSDDWMDPEEVKDLMSKVIVKNYDIVYTDYYENYLSKEKTIIQDFGTNKYKCIASMLSGKMHCSNCNKIFKRSLYFDNNIFYIDGANMHEDVGVVLRLFAVANNIGYINKAYYHYYQSNLSSLLRSVSTKQKRRRDCLQRIKNVDTAIKFLKSNNVWNQDIQRAAADCELRAKDELIDDTTYSIKRWIVTFPEADKAIWHSPHLTLNMRLLLTWLHFHQICLYKLQKSITNFLSNHHC